MPDSTLKPGEVGSVVDLALVMEVSRQSIHDWMNKPGFPVPIDGVFSVKRVVEWKLRREFEAERRRVMASVGDDDPLLTAGDSPGLERYRLAKARLTEMDVEIRERSHYDGDSLRDGLEIITRNYRWASEAIQRQFGPEAFELLQEAMATSALEIGERFGPRTDEPEEGEP